MVASQHVIQLLCRLYNLFDFYLIRQGNMAEAKSITTDLSTADSLAPPPGKTRLVKTSFKDWMIEHKKMMSIN